MRSIYISHEDLIRYFVGKGEVKLDYESIGMCGWVQKTAGHRRSNKPVQQSPDYFQNSPTLKVPGQHNQ